GHARDRACRAPPLRGGTTRLSFISVSPCLGGERSSRELLSVPVRAGGDPYVDTARLKPRALADYVSPRAARSSDRLATRGARESRRRRARRASARRRRWRTSQDRVRAPRTAGSTTHGSAPTTRRARPRSRPHRPPSLRR